MKWASEYNKQWQRRFALFPTYVNAEYVVWLQYYWRRYVPINNGKPCECGSHVVGKYETKLEKPND